VRRASVVMVFAALLSGLSPLGTVRAEAHTGGASGPAFSSASRSASRPVRTPRLPGSVFHALAQAHARFELGRYGSTAPLRDGERHEVIDALLRGGSGTRAEVALSAVAAPVAGQRTPGRTLVWENVRGSIRVTDPLDDGRLLVAGRPWERAFDNWLQRWSPLVRYTVIHPPGVPAELTLEHLRPSGRDLAAIPLGELSADLWAAVRDLELRGQPLHVNLGQPGGPVRLDDLYPGRSLRPTTVSLLAAALAVQPDGAQGILRRVRGGREEFYNVLTWHGQVFFFDQAGYRDPYRLEGALSFLPTRGSTLPASVAIGRGDPIPTHGALVLSPERLFDLLVEAPYGFRVRVHVPDGRPGGQGTVGVDLVSRWGWDRSVDVEGAPTWLVGWNFRALGSAVGIREMLAAGAAGGRGGRYSYADTGVFVTLRPGR
jgi:hypothetical protein